MSKFKDSVAKHFKRTGAFKTGHFILASGKESNVYVDCRLATLDAQALRIISSAFSDLFFNQYRDDEMPLHYGGVTSGADPIVTAVMSRMSLFFDGVQGFFVRKEAKDHGTKKKIEGHCPSGVKVAIFDDVATTGGSSQIAVDAAKEAGATVVGVYVIVDREEGAMQRFAEQGIPLYSLLTLKELEERLR